MDLLCDILFWLMKLIENHCIFQRNHDNLSPFVLFTSPSQLFPLQWTLSGNFTYLNASLSSCDSAMSHNQSPDVSFQLDLWASTPQHQQSFWLSCTAIKLINYANFMAWGLLLTIEQTTAMIGLHVERSATVFVTKFHRWLNAILILSEICVSILSKSSLYHKSFKWYLQIKLAFQQFTLSGAVDRKSI